MSRLGRLWQDDEGQDIVEYALLLVLLAFACVASMKTLASAFATVLNNAANNIAVSTS